MPLVSKPTSSDAMASDSAEETKTLTAQCYCKSLHFTVTLPVSKLPLRVHLCHCSICRYTHGAMSTWHAQLPPGVAPNFIAPCSMDTLSKYRSAGREIDQYFCSTCGCHMGDMDPKDGGWVIGTAFFPKDESVFQIQFHMYTESAPGGGFNDWLPRIGDRELKVWNPKDGSAKPFVPKAEVGKDGEERLRAECHCGGVSFTFPRPTEEVINDAFMKQYVSPVDKRKWVAMLDMCGDCRVITGTHVTDWTFVPLALCEPAIKPDLAIGTNKVYESSPGTQRSFCGTCGASIFFQCDARRPSERQNMVALTVGVLRAPEGVKADDWLTWRAGLIGWLESGKRFDEALTNAVGEGMAKWSIEKYGDAPNFEYDG